MDPLTALAALAPVVIEAGKAAVQRWVAPGDYKPTSIDDYVKMKELDVKLFEAINAAGQAAASYPQVEAIVRLMRPTVATAVIGTWAYCKLNSIPAESIDNFASAIGFYLFGDRTLFYAKKKL